MADLRINDTYKLIGKGDVLVGDIIGERLTVGDMLLVPTEKNITVAKIRDLWRVPGQSGEVCVLVKKVKGVQLGKVAKCIHSVN